MVSEGGKYFHYTVMPVGAFSANLTAKTIFTSLHPLLLTHETEILFLSELLLWEAEEEMSNSCQESSLLFSDFPLLFSCFLRN